MLPLTVGSTRSASMDLQFIVMLDGIEEEGEILDFLAQLPGWGRKGQSAFRAGGNFIEVRSHVRADATLASDSETGYLHFAWRIEFTPHSSDTEDGQVEFARGLATQLMRIREGHVKVEVLANFEDR